jgi:hypothetical protein
LTGLPWSPPLGRDQTARSPGSPPDLFEGGRKTPVTTAGVGDPTPSAGTDPLPLRPAGPEHALAHARVATPRRGRLLDRHHLCTSLASREADSAAAPERIAPPSATSAAATTPACAKHDGVGRRTLPARRRAPSRRGSAAPSIDHGNDAGSTIDSRLRDCRAPAAASAQPPRRRFSTLDKNRGESLSCEPWSPRLRGEPLVAVAFAVAEPASAKDDARAILTRGSPSSSMARSNKPSLGSALAHIYPTLAATTNAASA